MPSALNVSLTDRLREFVDSRTGDHSVFATPSEYMRALIRKDMEEQDIIGHVAAGLKDVKAGRFSQKTILDIANGQ
ncbi:MAG: antitoxin ParD1/3/4 [Paracoccaceae bacterium]|jgi:antitoxin ParD1/3/4